MKIRRQPTAAAIAVGSILASAIGVTIVAGGISAAAGSDAASSSVSTPSSSTSASVTFADGASRAATDATSTGS